MFLLYHIYCYSIKYRLYHNLSNIIQNVIRRNIYKDYKLSYNMLSNMKELGYELIKFSMIKETMSKYKLSILELLSEKQPLTISEIQRKLNISYKETYRHIKELTTTKLILSEKQTKTKHAPVNITLTEKGKKFISEIKELDEMKKEFDSTPSN